MSHQEEDPGQPHQQLAVSSGTEPGVNDSAEEDTGLVTSRLLRQMADGELHEDEPVAPAPEQEETNSEQEGESRSGEEGPAVTEESTEERNAVSGNEEESDDSYIQEYMKKLLGNGQQDELPEQESEEKEEATLLEKSFEKEVMERQQLLKPDEFLPKTSAPEKSSNMKAMRELANQSARSAIETSSRKRKFEQQSTLILILSGICFFAGASLAMVSEFALDLVSLGSIAFFALTGLGVWYYFDLKNSTSQGPSENGNP
ncbi:MAG: hypothetical protein VX768_11805 [Planctomycetota bacterium]|nr:hypothetical protein [Planctomycetota bacterium]